MEVLGIILVIVVYLIALGVFGWLCSAASVALLARYLRRKGCDVTTHYGLWSLRVRGFDKATKTLYRLRVGRPEPAPAEPYRGLRLVRNDDV